MIKIHYVINHIIVKIKNNSRFLNKNEWSKFMLEMSNIKYLGVEGVLHITSKLAIAYIQ
jgi:hypothetical protein